MHLPGKSIIIIIKSRPLGLWSVKIHHHPTDGYLSLIVNLLLVTRLHHLGDFKGMFYTTVSYMRSANIGDNRLSSQ